MIGFMLGDKIKLSTDSEHLDFREKLTIEAISHRMTPPSVRKNLAGHLSMVNLVVKSAPELFSGDVMSIIEDCVGDHIDALNKIRSMMNSGNRGHIDACITKDSLYLAKWAGGDEVEHSIVGIIGSVVLKVNKDRESLDVFVSAAQVIVNGKK